MFRKLPSVWFIGAVVAACVYVLGSSWTIGGTSEEYGIPWFLILVFATIVTGARTVLALGRPPEATAGVLRICAAVLRVCAAPILLVITWALLASSAPENLRLAFSKDSLDEYARTVTATDCTEDSFRPRQVGLYTVTCATRQNGRAVTLSVRDRLTPDGTGNWYLVGPANWKLVLED